MPSTSVVGWRALPTTIRRRRRAASPGWSAALPVRGVRARWRRTAGATRIASTWRCWAGKAELGVGADGRPRDPKKSARLKEGQSAAGCVVFWGDPAKATAPAGREGIETAAALALAHRAEIEAGDVVVAAALSTSGIRLLRALAGDADRSRSRPTGTRTGHQTIVAIVPASRRRAPSPSRTTSASRSDRSARPAGRGRRLAGCAATQRTGGRTDRNRRRSTVRASSR